MVPSTSSKHIYYMPGHKYLIKGKGKGKKERKKKEEKKEEKNDPKNKWTNSPRRVQLIGLLLV